MRVYLKPKYVLSGIPVLDKDGGRKVIAHGHPLPNDAAYAAISGGMWFEVKMTMEETDPRGYWFGKEPKELKLR